MKEITDLDEMIHEIIETSRRKGANIKNAEVFDLNYKPQKIYIRKELETVAERISDYLTLGIPEHLIIYGSRGSGKTVSMLSLVHSFSRIGDADFIYLNVRNAPTSYQIYQKISGTEKKGFSVSDLRKKSMRRMGDKTVLILDEIDFMKDFDILYHVPRSTKSSLVLLTQKTYWLKELDESIRSSMQSFQITFREYNSDEMYRILRLRAEEGLHKWKEEALALLSALVVRDHGSDARVGIKALFKIAMNDAWEEESVVAAVKETSREVEEELQGPL